MDDFGERMAGASWRERQTWAQHQGRTIERQSQGLRHDLVRFADGEGNLEDVRRMAQAVSWQALHVLAQAEAIERARKPTPAGD